MSARYLHASAALALGLFACTALAQDVPGIWGGRSAAPPRERYQSVVREYLRMQNCGAAKHETLSDAEGDALYKKLITFADRKFPYRSDVVQMNEALNRDAAREAANGQINADICRRTITSLREKLQSAPYWD